VLGGAGVGADAGAGGNVLVLVGSVLVPAGSVPHLAAEGAGVGGFGVGVGEGGVGAGDVLVPVGAVLGAAGSVPVMTQHHGTAAQVSSAGARRRDARWGAAQEVLDLVRRRPGVTRAEAARLLGLSTGSATDLVGRLRELALVAEAPAPASGRGRPTSTLAAHPQGPVVLAVDLRHEDWRAAVAGLAGIAEPGEPRRHGTDPQQTLAGIARAVAAARRRYRHRLRAVSVAVAGTVQDGRIRQASTLGWGAVDVGALGVAGRVPVLVGNDATLAGVAEARSGAATGAAAALHLTVEVGVGGTFVVGGLPQTGATGAGGEYGHLPFGDPALRCPCGARGCWDLEVDGRALARHLGADPPADAKSYARRVLARCPADSGARQAVRRVAAALGAGTAGLVNALDPEVVTVGGLAIEIRQAAGPDFDAAYLAGLMSFRRALPPPVQPAAHGDNGALHGAAEVGLDTALSAAGLAAWAGDRPG
jgi:predicted NBD/HSP70 family sugar kinase